MLDIKFQADLWSIGVIFYEAIFGKAPFSCETLEKLVVKIKEDVPVVIPNNRNIRYKMIQMRLFLLNPFCFIINKCLKYPVFLRLSSDTDVYVRVC